MSAIKECGNIAESHRKYCYVVWKIKHFFSHAVKDGVEWISPTFRFADATWYLSIYPNTKLEDKSFEYIDMFLHKTESTSVYDVFFTIGIKENGGRYFAYRNTTQFFERNDFAMLRLERSHLECNEDKVAVNGKVTFFCKVHVLNEYGVEADSQTPTYYDFSALSQDFKSLFVHEEDTDVTIKVKNKEFRVHSLILAARSSVFAPMFKHDMKEKNTGIVDVEDCDPEAFKQFLFFLYSGKVEELSSENAIDLYCAAEKYNVMELKILCSDFMKEGISVGTFCDVISFAIRYKDTELVDYATEYFVKNAKAIIVTVKWMSFVKDYPVESNELIIKTLNQVIPAWTWN